MPVLDRFRVEGKRLFVTGGSRGRFSAGRVEAGLDIGLPQLDAVSKLGRRAEAPPVLTGWAAMGVGIATHACRSIG